MAHISYQDGYQIFRKGDKGDLFYVIQEGNVEMSNLGLINKTKTLGPGGYFGQRALVGNGGKRTANATAVGDCILLYISKEVFETIIGSLEDVIHLARQKRILMSVSFFKKANLISQDSTNLETSVTLDVLNKVKKIGQGTFGKVYLVTDKRNNNRYAMKIQNMREIIEKRQANAAIREKYLMASINHPFICKLINCFRDENYLFMVMEHAQGGDLFSLIHTKQSDGLPEDSARFYAANVYDGLMHLHERQILYRDLKPEVRRIFASLYFIDKKMVQIRLNNVVSCTVTLFFQNILIGSDGYCIICDLGSAKFVVEKTYTLCGTPLYIAPEIIYGKGYDKAVDNWSFGVLVYEMLFGYSPFYSSLSDKITLYNRIVTADYSFPPNCSKASHEAKELISKLLVVDTSVRLGCFAGGDNDIRNHRWLSRLPQSEITSKMIEAPFRPKNDSSINPSTGDWDFLKQDVSFGHFSLSDEEMSLFQNY